MPDGRIEGVSRLGAESEYVERCRLAGPANFETFIQQNKAYAMLDILAQAAHPSRPSLSHLLAVARVSVRQGRGSVTRDWFKAGDQRVLLSIARILANRRESPSDLHSAMTLFKVVFGLWGKSAFNRRNRMMFLETLSDLRFSADLERYSARFAFSDFGAPFLGLFKANQKNCSQRTSQEGSLGTVSFEEWCSSLNSVLALDDLEPLSFIPGSEPLFDRIICEPSERVPDGPLVTVVVPTYDADSRFNTAMKSIVNQSWRNLQIVVVDDFTPGGVPPVVERWSRVDSRVSVHQMQANGGTYRSRNYVLDEIAKGEYFTVHDDDDWSHPRKIQRQVEDLARSGSPVNMSMLSRATSDLVFCRINNNPDYVQKNYSSLMFDVATVRSNIGFWDEVNRSGDAEYIDRLQAWTGRPIPSVGTVPLSFLRVRESSLTSGEISRGYIDTRRRWYQLASREFLDGLTEAPDVGSFYRSRHEESIARDFSAPVDMQGSRQGRQVPEFDVVYATDFRFPGGNSSVTANEVSALADAGFTVGMLQVDSPLNGIRSRIHPRLLEVSVRSEVGVISELDRVKARAVIARHPSIVQFLSGARSGVDCSGQVAMIVNNQAIDPNGGGSTYDPSDVLDNCSAFFGRETMLWAESVITRDSLRGLVDPRFVQAEIWSALVERPDLSPRADLGVFGEHPVVGRHGRDHVLKWPGNRDSLVRAYPVDGSFDIRVLGGAKEAERVFGSSLADVWTVFDYGEKPVPDFLSELDFWVYMHSDRLRESFGMAAAEAMLAGVVTILPEYMRSTFGDGAIYSKVGDVSSKIKELLADPKAYRSQALSGRRYIKEHFGADRFLNRVRSLMG